MQIKYNNFFNEIVLKYRFKSNCMVFDLHLICFVFANANQ